MISVCYSCYYYDQEIVGEYFDGHGQQTAYGDCCAYNKGADQIHSEQMMNMKRCKNWKPKGETNE